MAGAQAIVGISGEGSKKHAEADTLGLLLEIVVKPANLDVRTLVEALAVQVQAVTGDHVEVARVDRLHWPGGDGDRSRTGHPVRSGSAAQGQTSLCASALLPGRWAVERSFAWLARFRRLARDY